MISMLWFGISLNKFIQKSLSATRISFLPFILQNLPVAEIHFLVLQYSSTFAFNNF